MKDLARNCRVRITIDSLELEGGEVAPDEVLVLADEDLSVTLELMRAGEVTRVPGRLSRRGSEWVVRAGPGPERP